MIDYIKRSIALSYLLSKSQRNIENYPQVAVFSFDLVSTLINIDGIFDKAELNFLREKLFPLIGNECAIDIGANIGNHSLQFSRSFKKVYAFEPNIRTYELMKFNCSQVDNIECFNLAASDTHGKCYAYSSRSNIGGTSIGEKSLSDSKLKTIDKVTFRLVKLDDCECFHQLSSIDFVKIDVEGHESKSIDGFKKMISRHTPVICMEQLRKEISGGSSPSVDILKGMGYQFIYEITQRKIFEGKNIVSKSFNRIVVILSRLLKLDYFTESVGKRIFLLDNRTYSMLILSTFELDL